MTPSTLAKHANGGTIRSRERARAMSRRAHRVKAQRSALKEQLTAGHIHIAEVLMYPEPWARGMRAVDILRHLPRVRRVKAMRALEAIDANAYTTLGALTSRQRRKLLEFFRENHPGVWALWNTMTRGRDEE